MKNQKNFSAGTFAKMARTSRTTLHFYDEIGLLSPAARGENRYRYYTIGQLAVVNVINIMQELGMSLAEIKEWSKKRTPESVYGLLQNQIEKIDGKIDEWVRSRKLLVTMRETISNAMGVNVDAVTIQYLPAEPIVLGGLNDYSRGRNDYDALVDFYKSMESAYPGLDMNYPVWACFSEDRIKRRDWKWCDRYYFYNPSGLDKRPASLYAVGYTCGGYGQTSGLYDRMLSYIDENGFEVSGDTYEEYPLNEVCISQENDYLIRVMISVAKRQ